MRPVDSQVLQDVARALRLYGPGGASETQFDDDIMQQVLDVAGLIRRGGTIAGSSGVWGVTIADSHAGAGTLTTDLDPYNLTPGVDVRGDYPSADAMRAYDAWMLGPVSGAGSGTLANFTAGALSLRYPADRMLAFDTVPAATNMNFAVYDGINANFGLELLGGGYTLGVACRIPKGCLIRWSSIASAAVNVQIGFTLGVFPAGMGQDMMLATLGR